ncbi:hypothetical protein [Ramlibacter montanisoli]|uniref:hypothetical protein n=1 Tax=Ramlibacter montanisoli TaxID=2732512 RepID=UPI002815BB96|nr:hypothetical protein [Ramlibacter montanisoli]
METDPRVVEAFRIYRNAVPLKHPITGAVLGYEAKYLGSAELVRSESVQPVLMAGGGTRPTIVPATVDITRAKEEIRVGDRLMPEPVRGFGSYVPRAPRLPVDGAIVSVYGDAVTLVGQSQVVALSLGMVDGLEPGNVLQILRSGRRVDDRTEAGERALVKLARRAQRPADGVPHLRPAVLCAGAGDHRHRLHRRPGDQPPLSARPCSATSWLAGCASR